MPRNTKYGTFFGTGLYNTEAEAAQVLAKEGTARNLYIRVSGSPGSGKSWTFTVFKNDSAQTFLTCTISDAATACSDTNGSISFDSGDTISIRIVGAGNPSLSKVGSWGLQYA